MEVSLIRRMVTRRIISPRTARKKDGLAVNCLVWRGGCGAAQLIQVMVTCGEWRGGRSPGQGRVPTAGVGRLIAAVVLWRIGFRRWGGIDQYPD